MKPRPVRLLDASIFCIFLFTAVLQQNLFHLQKPSLRFGPEGTFKIVQFADIQDGPNTDQRTLKLMNQILDFEKPDFVVLTGDNTDGKCRTEEDVRKAIDNIAQPMEKRHIPWAVAFGNHDDEHRRMSKEKMMKLYMSYPYNLSSPGTKDIDGIGNYNLLVKSCQGNNPAFNIYLLDSGKYGRPDIGGYDWIKFSQIGWYRNTSAKLRNKYSKTIPALMFFHIPLPEFKQAWKSGNTVGEKNQEECIPQLNSGLFTSLIEMGDVKGVFVGHDHINDYTGSLYGIKLGYSRSIGYGTYGKEGFERGARVFLINESNPSDFQTWIRLASDF